MGGWLTNLGSLVYEATSKSGLDRYLYRAFDGDSWVWGWRERAEVPEGATARLREAAFMARTDALEETVFCQVVGRVWLESDHEAGWSRAYFADARPARQFDPIPADHQWRTQVPEALARAWKEADVQPERLRDFKERRSKAIESALSELQARAGE